MNGRGFLGEGAAKGKRARGRNPLKDKAALHFSCLFPVFPSSLAFSAENPAIINPRREPGEAEVSARVVLACTRPDFQLLSRIVEARQPVRYLWNCGVRAGTWGKRPVTVAGPVLGAPCAAMVLEKLIALGAKAVVALGWGGSLQSQVGLGSLVLPTVALGADGTSPHYRLADSDFTPDPGLCQRLKEYLARNPEPGIPWHSGAIWTTDAFYRETPAAVRHYQGRGVLAVDLEMAALFAVGRFRGIAVAGLLAVSDDLSALSWRPGHRSEDLRRAREAAARTALAALAAWEGDHA